MATPTTACPSAVEMSNLVLRPLQDSEVDKLACHLEQCSACARQAELILNGDPMEAAMRETAGALDTAQMPDARELVERLKKLVVPGALGRDTRAATPASPNDGTQCWAADDAVESLDFLRPPQQPDELGRLGQYRLLKKLGAGGMGIVFLAEDALLHRKVALKMMLPQFVAKPGAKERFLREARAAASIEHDHIVPIFQVGEDNGTPFLAMQFLKGEPLDACLAREGRLPVAEALRIARGMAEGLAAAHANNLIHRDIKPSNVWLEARTDGINVGSPAPSRVRLLDFGLARTVDDTSQLTQAGQIIGTPAFMAPEQARGDQVDGRADLFSLGCVLYGMLTGQAPFRGTNTLSLLTALVLETPQTPTVVNFDIPKEVSDLTMRLLSKDLADRPESAAAVATAIVALQEGKGSPRPAGIESTRDPIGSRTPSPPAARLVGRRRVRRIVGPGRWRCVLRGHR
jgi:serine/threonine protein kinase